MKITLEELKKDVYKLIEEIDENSTGYTSDPDYKAKFNIACNIVWNELYRLTDHVTLEEKEVKKGETINLLEDLDNFRLLRKIDGVEYDIVEQFVTFLEDGTAKIYYYQNPKQIFANSDDSLKLEADAQTINCLKYGIASDILLNDVSSSYGSYFKARYNELKNELDPRISDGIYYIEGGID